MVGLVRNLGANNSQLMEGKNMEGKVNVGYGNIYLIPFKNSAFELDVKNQTVIRPVTDIDSETNNVLTYGKNTKTLITAGGAKIIYTLPNEESGMFKFNVLNPVSDSLLLKMFPDASKITDATDGGKRKITIKDVPGLSLTTWDKMFKLIFKPLTAKGESGPNEWVTLPRVALVPKTEEIRGKEHSSTEITAMSVAGYDIGFKPEFTGKIDLTNGASLSGGTGKYGIKISIDGKVYDKIDLGSSATTTATAIVGAINSAVGSTVATIVAGKLKIEATKKGGTLKIEPPTGTLENGITKILKTDPSPISVIGLPEGDIPVIIMGDETAKE